MADAGDDLWAVIPVKPLAEGKSRIPLARFERSRLNRGFLDHILTVVGAVLPASRIVVVSRDAEVRSVAASAGAVPLDETGDGLNEALTQGAGFVAERGAAAVLSIFADLPHAAPLDLRAMIAHFDATNVVIAPDEAGAGSNAMLMAPFAIGYSHGPGSFWRHLAAARTAGRRTAIVARPGLSRDVDTAAHLAALTGPAKRQLVHACD